MTTKFGHNILILFYDMATLTTVFYDFFNLLCTLRAMLMTSAMTEGTRKISKAALILIL